VRAVGHPCVGVGVVGTRLVEHRQGLSMARCESRITCRGAECNRDDTLQNSSHVESPFLDLALAAGPGRRAAVRILIVLFSGIYGSHGRTDWRRTENLRISEELLAPVYQGGSDLGRQCVPVSVPAGAVYRGRSHCTG